MVDTGPFTVVLSALPISLHTNSATHLCHMDWNFLCPGILADQRNDLSASATMPHVSTSIHYSLLEELLKEDCYSIEARFHTYCSLIFPFTSVCDLER